MICFAAIHNPFTAREFVALTFATLLLTAPAASAAAAPDELLRTIPASFQFAPSNTDVCSPTSKTTPKSPAPSLMDRLSRPGRKTGLAVSFPVRSGISRSEEHTSELQSLRH